MAGGAVTRILRVAAQAGPGERNLIDSIAEGIKSAGLRPRTRVVVQLPIHPVQRRFLTNLPPGSPSEVRRLVRHQAARFFRTPEDGLVIDVARHPSGTGYIAVALDVSIARGVLRATEAAGLKVRDLVPPPDEAARGLSLLPPEVVASRRTAGWRATGLLAIGAGLFAVTLGFGVWTKVNRQAAIAEVRAAGLEPLSSRLELLRRQLDSVAGMVEAVATLRRVHEGILNQLGFIGRSLPDSAVLSSMTIHQDGAVELAGVALEPLDVLARLQRAGTLSSARLEVAQPADPTTGRAWRHFRVKERATDE